jgi:hypothetical protein
MCLFCFGRKARLIKPAGDGRTAATSRAAATAPAPFNVNRKHDRVISQVINVNQSIIGLSSTKLSQFIRCY